MRETIDFLAAVDPLAWRAPVRKSQVRLSALCRAEGCTTCKVSLVDVLLLASAEQKPGGSCLAGT